MSHQRQRATRMLPDIGQSVNINVDMSPWIPRAVCALGLPCGMRNERLDCGLSRQPPLSSAHGHDHRVAPAQLTAQGPQGRCAGSIDEGTPVR